MLLFIMDYISKHSLCVLEFGAVGRDETLVTTSLLVCSFCFV